MSNVPTGPPKPLAVPVIAPDHPHVRLLDDLSGHVLEFAWDDGSCATLAAAAAVARLGLAMDPPDITTPQLFGADNSSFVPAVGQVRMHLRVPNRQQCIAVTGVVVESLFVDFLLGRNAILGFRQLYGADGLWAGTRPVALSSISAIASRRLRDGIDCNLVSDILSPPESKAGTLSSVEVISTACFWLSEADLTTKVGRIDAMQGVFQPLSKSYAHVAAAVVTATVDWSAAGKRGDKRRVLLPVCILALHSAQGGGKYLQRAGALVGRFVLGSPIVAPLLAGDAKTDLLKDVIARSVTSPLLAMPEQRALAEQALRKFRFVEDLPEAGRARIDPFVIELVPGAQPLAKRNYPLSVDDERFAEEQIAKWLKSGTIRPSQSPWSSPIVIAHHPRTGKPRLCVDYRGLNAATIPDHYPMPLIQDISRAIRNCSVFSKIDLAQGFNQFGVQEESRPLTAFRGPRSHKYEFVGSPFGLRNLPSAFQRMMDRVLGSMLWEHAACYIDDIIVFSPDTASHHHHLEALAARLAQFNLAVRASKCAFYVREVEYLGFIFDGKTMRVDPDRLKPIVDLEAPANPAEARQFLGLMGQFRHLIFDFASIADPLERIKHKNAKARFDCSPGSPAHAAFIRLKAELLRIPTVHIPDMNRPFRCYVDASKVAMSLVLVQMVDGQECVIAFYSKAFTASQRLWATPMKECHALHYFAMNKVWPYLACGGPHEIMVDNLSAAALAKLSLANSKLQRMALDLQGLQLKIIKIPGSRNLADAPTRPPFIRTDETIERELRSLPSPLHNNPGWQEILRLAEEQEQAASQPVVAGAVSGVSPASALAPAELSHLNLPSVVALVAKQQVDPELQRIISFVTAGRPSPPEEATQKERVKHLHLSREASGCVVLDSGLLVHTSTVRNSVAVRAAIPKEMRAALLEKAHMGPAPNVHGGRHGAAMLAELSRSVWWPGMHSACMEYECATCCRQKKSHSLAGGLLHSTLARRPGEVVSIDVVPLVKVSGYVGYVLMLDKFSGALAAVPVRSKTSTAIIDAWDSSMGSWLMDIETMYVDQDSALLSDELAKYKNAHDEKVEGGGTSQFRVENRHFVCFSPPTLSHRSQHFFYFFIHGRASHFMYKGVRIQCAQHVDANGVQLLRW